MMSMRAVDTIIISCDVSFLFLKERDDMGTLDFGLSLGCAVTQSSMRVGRSAQNWRAGCVTMDLVYCYGDSSMPASGSMREGRIYCNTGGNISDHGLWSTASTVLAVCLHIYAVCWREGVPIAGKFT